MNDELYLIFVRDNKTDCNSITPIGSDLDTHMLLIENINRIGVGYIIR